MIYHGIAASCEHTLQNDNTTTKAKKALIVVTMTTDIIYMEVMMLTEAHRVVTSSGRGPPEGTAFICIRFVCACVCQKVLSHLQLLNCVKRCQ